MKVLLGSGTGSASAHIFIWVAVPGKFHILSKYCVTFPAKDSICFQQACRENIQITWFLTITEQEIPPRQILDIAGSCSWWKDILLSPLFSLYFSFFPSCHYKSGPFSPPDIRHPEELSLLRKPRDPSKKKKKKLDDQCEDDTFELEGPLITPGSGELGEKNGSRGKTGAATWGWLNFLRSVQETDPKSMAQVVAGCSTRSHGCMSGAGAVTHSREQSNPRLHRTNQSLSVATWALRSCCWELFLP